MGRYICGPSILRREGRQAIVPGELFEEGFSEAEEASLIKAGAIRLAPEPSTPPASTQVRPSRRSTKKETEE